MKISRVALTLALLTRAVLAQQNATQQGGAGYTIRARSSLVLLPTRVETKGGDTMYGLRADQFLVQDQGVRQIVRIEETPDSASLSLVVAIQCGRSAPAEFGKLKGLATMIDGIVGSAPHEVAVVVYGERPYLLSDFSERSEDTRSALARLKSCGDYHAATVDAAHYSLSLLRLRQNRYRRAILLIGEQRDHGSTSKLHEVVAELGTTNTVIYSVAFSPTKSQFLRELRYGPDGPTKSDPPVVYPLHPSNAKPKSAQATEDFPEDPHYTDHAPLFSLPPLLMLAVNALRENTASEIASLSGGEYLDFVSQKGLEQALHRIANQVHNYYLLSFRPESPQKLESHSLKVSIVGHPEAVIQTRTSYWSGIP